MAGSYVARYGDQVDRHGRVVLLVLHEGGTFTWTEIELRPESPAVSPLILKGGWESAGDGVRIINSVFSITLKRREAGLVLPSAQGDVLLLPIAPSPPSQVFGSR